MQQDTVSDIDFRPYIERVDARLNDVLPTADVPPARLHEAMRYAVLNGGKRLRPALTYATGECLGSPSEPLDAPAVAIELIHAFSLVHDDLPAMDDDDLRRGKPTCHRQFDEATAILAADALQPLAFLVLSQTPSVRAEQRVALAHLLAVACGSLGMTGGQSLDLDAEGKKLDAHAIETIFAMKTGALIRAAVLSAAIVADVDDDDFAALDTFSTAIGLAFQIKDDLLDVEGTTEDIGKPAGSDLKHDKSTYPAVAGIDAARRRCDELTTEALEALERFGERADILRRIARFIVSRGS